MDFLKWQVFMLWYYVFSIASYKLNNILLIQSKKLGKFGNYLFAVINYIELESELWRYIM